MYHKLASQADVWYNGNRNIGCLKGATWQFSTPRLLTNLLRRLAMTIVSPSENNGNLLPSKPCRKCGDVKSLDEFFRNKHRPDGREATCKVCQKPDARKAQARYYARVPHHMRPGRSKAMRAASIGFKDFEQAYVQQGGLCAICGKPETARYHGGTMKLAVDHDHKTGKFRGLLCKSCNIKLAVLEDTEFVNAAMDYLAHNQSCETGQEARLVERAEEEMYV